MADENIASTWASRELPILRSILRRVDAGQDLPDVKDIAQDTGLDRDQLRIGVRALDDAGYITATGGPVERIHERTRRELGSWPAAADVVDRLVEALERAADEATAPEERSRLRALAEVLGGVARDLAVSVVAARIGDL